MQGALGTFRYGTIRERSSLEEFTPFSGLAGGMLIGLTAAMLVSSNEGGIRLVEFDRSHRRESGGMPAIRTGSSPPLRGFFTAGGYSPLASVDKGSSPSRREGAHVKVREATRSLTTRSKVAIADSAAGLALVALTSSPVLASGERPPGQRPMPPPGRTLCTSRCTQ